MNSPAFLITCICYLLLLFAALFRLRCRSGLFFGSRIPTVQAVCDAVAIAAFREAGQHASRVWCAVAALASRHHLVFVFVAGDTSYALMLGVACGKKIIGLLVA